MNIYYILSVVFIFCCCYHDTDQNEIGIAVETNKVQEEIDAAVALRIIDTINEAYVKLENEWVILYDGDDDKVINMVAIGNEYAHILSDWNHYNDNLADTVEIVLYPHCGEEGSEDWKVPTFKVYDKKGLKEVRDINPNYRILQVVIADIKENTLHLELADPMDWGHSALYPSFMEFEEVDDQLRLKKIQFEDGC